MSPWSNGVSEAGRRREAEGIVLGDTLVGPRAGFDDCDLSLRHWIARSGVECDLFWNGCLELARDPSLSDRPVDWNENGRVRLAARVSGGVLDPSKLQTELARLAPARGRNACRRRRGARARAGFSIFAGVVVVTERGSLRADHVIMAVDTMAWRPLLDPWAERVITVALTTEPLPDDVIGVLGLAAPGLLHAGFSAFVGTSDARPVSARRTRDIAVADPEFRDQYSRAARRGWWPPRVEGSRPAPRAARGRRASSVGWADCQDGVGSAGCCSRPSYPASPVGRRVWRTWPRPGVSTRPGRQYQFRGCSSRLM